MPIVDVELVGAAISDRGRIASELADALGAIFASSPGGTWVRVRSLAVGDYAENGMEDPVGREAVFVTVLKHSLPQRDELARQARLISSSVAKIVRRDPERVHILFEGVSGRIAFGGELMD